jgi:hypothetical protein
MQMLQSLLKTQNVAKKKQNSALPKLLNAKKQCKMVRW